MESTTAQLPDRRRPVVYIVVLATALAAIAASIFGLVQNSNLSSKVDKLTTQLANQQTTVAGLESRLTEQHGVDAGSVKTLEVTVKKLQARVKLYDTCVPEIMGQINSLSGNVASTGPLYISPTQTVSHFCQPILFGLGSSGN